MRLRTNMYIIIPLLIALSCGEEPPQSSPSEPLKLEVVWRTPIVPEGNFSGSISMNPVPYENAIVFNSEYDLNGYSSPVIFLDTANGTTLDYWSDYSDGPFTYSSEAMAFENELLLLGGQRSVDCINLNTRQTQWHGPVGDNSPFIYIHDGFLYRGIEYNGQNPHNYSAAVMRTPIDVMNWDTVYAFDRTDNFKPGFSSMGFGTLHNGDEVVVWKNRSFIGSTNRTDIFAYNLTADTLLWRNMEFNESSGIIPLRIEDGVVYGLLQYHAVAIDLTTGETLWKTDFRRINTTIPGIEFFGGDLHVEPAHIIIKSQSDELIALRRNTGKPAWMKQDVSLSPDDRFTYFEGKLFYAAHKLVVVDVMSGESLLKEQRTEHLGDVRSRIVIDPVRRVMYMHNGREALCVKIPPDL